MSEASPATHPASAPLFAAWQASGRRERLDILTGLRVPGPVPLRSRYRHLLDPEAPPGPWDADWSMATWQAVLRLEAAGDQAVQRNDADAARAAYTELLGLESVRARSPAGVHAHIGFGDIGLAAEDPETAIGEYEGALALAAEAGYRFGRLRALVGLGYVTLMFHSAGAALRFFTEAHGLAQALDDPVYAGNAVLGLAETRERLGDLDQAIGHAEEAYRICAGIRSPLGRGNAAQRLGSMLHRQRRRDEARVWLERAHAAFLEAGNPMGLTNALSGLGDVLLDGDDPDGAERAYREGLRVAEAASLPRSRAHALQDLARVARSRADWETAAVQFSGALAAYREIDDLLGMSNSASKLAESYVRLGRDHEAMRVRLDAVFAIEEYRATHRDEASQREYRDRFTSTYAAALEAATQYHATGSFAVVGDCLAGRRLAGLFAETARAELATGNLALLQELLVRADQRVVTDRRRRDTAAAPPEQAGPPEEHRPPEGGRLVAGLDSPGSRPQERRERVIRLLGAAGIRHGLAPQAETSLDDLLATVYLPPADEGDALLAALPTACHVLQVLIDPQDAGLVRWLWRDASGVIHIGTAALRAEAARLLAVLQDSGDERIGLRVFDLAPLRDLLPEPLREKLSGGSHRLVIVPVGQLWFVPWSAIPLDDGRVLGEAASYVVCPSLTVQRQLATRGSPGQAAAPRQVDVWRSPFVRNHGLAAVQQHRGWTVTMLSSPAAVRSRLHSGTEAMVIAGHGRPAPGLGHYLELDSDEWLLPVDMMGARPPRRLAMIACWGGAIPGRGATDPLSIATLALAAGTTEILATVGELADSVLASRYVEWTLGAMADRPIPEALQAATRWAMSDEAVRSERIFHWAPLVPFGTFY